MVFVHAIVLLNNGKFDTVVAELEVMEWLRLAPPDDPLNVIGSRICGT